MASFSTSAGCVVVIGSTGADVTLASANAGTGDILLLVQVQSAFGTVGETLDIASPGDAGRWHLSRVESVSGAVVRLASSPDSRFASGGGEAAQACRVPQHTDLTVAAGGTLAPPPWNGSTGGVLAIIANGIVRVDGALDATSLGLRGGTVVKGSNDAEDVTDLTTTEELAGGKGEGADPASFGTYGRGNLANGGGGGNAHNGGGGGGGNAGRGGHGGRQFEGAGLVMETRGMPGVALTREGLYLGGGGGSGESHHSNGAHGGAGGGIVVLLARRLEGAGSISADGASVADIHDGGGGGGAGGTILVVTSSSAFSGVFSAKGGDGGGCVGNSSTEDLGPGGGGGGGRIVAPSANADVSGGSNGANAASGETWDSEPGEPGILKSS